jgi:hypothetical protein
MKPYTALASLLLLASCVRDITDKTVKLQSFRVTFAPGTSTGAPDSRLPFSGTTPVSVSIHLEALGSDGLPFPFTGRLLATTEPGQIFGGGDLINVVNGVGDATVQVRLAFGDTAIWVQDVDPVQGNGGNFSCSGGCPDGSLCMPKRQPSGICSGPSATHSIGASPILFFEDPRISDIQTTLDANTSSLDAESLTVSGGVQIVTAVAGNGFFLTDIDDEDQRFNSIFVFTFNQPEEVGVGDRLAKVSGIVAEFVGTTQLTQPGFDIIEENRTDLIPNPKEIEPGEVTDFSGLTLEPFESGLVSVTDVRLPLTTKHCDNPSEGGDGNGALGGTTEFACADACAADIECQELTNFIRFGQYAVVMKNNQTKIQVVSRDTIRDFDPIAPENLGRSISKIVGTLRDVQFADPRWIVQPRFPSDLILDASGN